jgi:hypothetical protein
VTARLEEAPTTLAETSTESILPALPSHPSARLQRAANLLFSTSAERYAVNLRRASAVRFNGFMG